MILFLDACILIYWMETAEPFYSRLMAKLRTFYQQDSRTEIAVSRLSQLECLVKPLQAMIIVSASTLLYIAINFGKLVLL